MKSLRVRFVLASMLMLSASTLSAQAGRVSCKDGSKPKGGHFSCWGHGGIVTGALKSAAKSDAKAGSKGAPKHKAASKAKKTAGNTAGKTAHSTPAKADKQKAHPKRTSKRDKH